MKEGLETFVYFIAASTALLKLYYTGDSSLAIGFIAVSFLLKFIKKTGKEKRKRR